MVKKDNSSQLTEKRKVRATGDAKADWRQADADDIRAALSSVCALGAAITFGYNTERTAYTITILSGGDKHTEFVEADRDVSEYLRRVAEAWRA